MQLIFVANMDAEFLRSLANVNATTDVHRPIGNTTYQCRISYVVFVVIRVNGVTTARKTTGVQTATTGEIKMFINRPTSKST